jgi:hypothetical protein
VIGGDQKERSFLIGQGETCMDLCNIKQLFHATTFLYIYSWADGYELVIGGASHQVGNPKKKV